MRPLERTAHPEFLDASALFVAVSGLACEAVRAEAFSLGQQMTWFSSAAAPGAGSLGQLRQLVNNLPERMDFPGDAIEVLPLRLAKFHGAEFTDKLRQRGQRTLQQVDALDHLLVFECVLASALQHVLTLVVSWQPLQQQELAAVLRHRDGGERKIFALAGNHHADVPVEAAVGITRPEDLRLREKVVEHGKRFDQRHFLGAVCRVESAAEPGRRRLVADAEQHAAGQAFKDDQVEVADQIIKQRLAQIPAVVAHVPTMLFVSFMNASSTPSPVLALVLTIDHPDSASFHKPRSSTRQSSARSALLRTRINGTAPTTPSAVVCSCRAVSSVSWRVPSATSR